MKSTSPQYSRASFFRRLAAMIYDTLVAVAVGMCAAMVMLVSMLLLTENNILSNQGYEHFSDLIRHSLAYQLSLQIWVAIWVMGFFIWFWRNGGQTIGMRAWRLRLFSTNEQPFGYARACLRLLGSLGGLGTLLVLFDYKNKQSLQDYLAKTEVVVLSKEDNHHAAWKKIQE